MRLFTRGANRGDIVMLSMRVREGRNKKKKQQQHQQKLKKTNEKIPQKRNKASL